MGLPGVRGQERLTGGRGGQAESRSANTACCHKHNRYMSRLGSVGQHPRTNVQGKEEESGEGSGAVGFHSVVICSSCFHTGGIVRLSVSLSGVSLCVVQLIRAQTRWERKRSGS